MNKQKHFLNKVEQIIIKIKLSFFLFPRNKVFVITSPPYNTLIDLFAGSGAMLGGFYGL